MRRWISFMLLVGLALTACARSPRPAVSYVSSKVTPAEIDILVADAARYLYAPLPPAQTTVLLAPTKSRAATVLSAALAEQLRATGYGVIESDTREHINDPHVVPLRYLVSWLDDGIVLHLQYRNIEASRFYPRAADGRLMPTAPFAVRGTP